MLLPNLNPSQCQESANGKSLWITDSQQVRSEGTMPESAEAVNSGSVPIVSIGMPVLNSESTLRVAIQSILNQDFSDWELLLIDDGSTDETAKIIRSYADPRIRAVADGTHRGHGARLNQAVDISHGKYFARMDGDDISFPERLALQVGYMTRNPEIDLIGGRILVFGCDGYVTGIRGTQVSHEQICRWPWSGFHLAHPTWLGRIEWFRKHRYRPEVPLCQDQDLLLRTYKISRFAAVPEIVLGYREILSLKKILTTRRAFAAALVREGILKRKYGFAAAGLFGQSVKALIDCVAIGTGLDYRLLRNRAASLADEAVVERWWQIWQQVHFANGDVSHQSPSDRVEVEDRRKGHCERSEAR